MVALENNLEDANHGKSTIYEGYPRNMVFQLIGNPGINLPTTKAENKGNFAHEKRKRGDFNDLYDVIEDGEFIYFS